MRIIKGFSKFTPMKRVYKLSIVFVAAVLLCVGCGRNPFRKHYDICIYGGTSAGVVAAVAAARSGCSVVLIEPTTHIGGLTTGGLGYTDIGNKQVVMGIAKQFYRKMGSHYGRLEAWTFEPHVADSVFKSMLAAEKRITVAEQWRVEDVDKDEDEDLIRNITVADCTDTARRLKVHAKVWIDCSYEGDLMARSGVSYTVGRESNATYNETFNGVQMLEKHQFPDSLDPYVVPGDSTSGLLWGISADTLAVQGSGDSHVQAYNYRICLTDKPTNRLRIDRPENYDPSHYELLRRLIRADRDRHEKYGKEVHLTDYLFMAKMPNGKTDINNNGPFSTDMIGGSDDYPEASYEERAKIVKGLEDYTKGFLYFLAHDSIVPERMRERAGHWGLPKDEFTDCGNWSPQIYVRETRRMIGEYVVTQANCLGQETVEDGIALAAYTMDSHNCQRLVIRKNGVAMVKNEGDVQIGGAPPFDIPYRAIVPKRDECVNLLVPVCLSASHIAFGAIRMEPVFMVLGQSAAMAATIYLKQSLKCVQDVDASRMREMSNDDPFIDGSTPDIIIDDTYPNVTFTDEWRQVTAVGGYGPTFLALTFSLDTVESPVSRPLQTVQYKVNPYKSATYALYVYQQFLPVLSRNCRYSLVLPNGCKVVSDVREEQAYTHKVAGGIEYTKTMDLRQMKTEGQTSGDWVRIGVFSLQKGIPIELTLTNLETSGMITSDAILLTENKTR